jgi:PD-(D/E)XK nuclease superfamily
VALGRMSGLARLLDCPGCLSIEQEDKPYSANAAEAAIHGTRIHAVKEGLPVLDPECLYAEDSPYWHELVALYKGWEHEVHVAYRLEDHKAFRYATEDGKRLATANQPTVLTGCLDAQLVVPEENWIHVNDLKTGENPEDLDSPQLLGYLLAALTLGIQSGALTKDATCDLSVLHYPRTGWWRKRYLTESGRPWRWCQREVPLEELREFRRQLTDLVLRVKEKELVAGDHCVFCPGHSACPLWTNTTLRKH